MISFPVMILMLHIVSAGRIHIIYSNFYIHRNYVYTYTYIFLYLKRQPKNKLEKYKHFLGKKEKGLPLCRKNIYLVTVPQSSK